MLFHIKIFVILFFLLQMKVNFDVTTHQNIVIWRLTVLFLYQWRRCKCLIGNEEVKIHFRDSQCIIIHSIIRVFLAQYSHQLFFYFALEILWRLSSFFRIGIFLFCINVVAVHSSLHVTRTPHVFYRHGFPSLNQMSKEMKLK